MYQSAVMWILFIRQWSIATEDQGTAGDLPDARLDDRQASDADDWMVRVRTHAIRSPEATAAACTKGCAMISVNTCSNTANSKRWILSIAAPKKQQRLAISVHLCCLIVLRGWQMRSPSSVSCTSNNDTLQGAQSWAEWLFSILVADVHAVS